MSQDYGSAASGMDASLYPVAVLIDELRHDDLQLRLNSIRNLGTIATALGPQRTREELIPFLQDIIDDDDEVLISLAEQLGLGVPWVGGPAYAHTLTGPLEELCNIEEISVREKAIEALKALASQMSAEQVMRHLYALISRLASHDWFTSRISVCSLFVAVLAKVGEEKQGDLLKMLFKLCGDDTPMVRRQAANVLGSVAEVLHQDSMLNQLMEHFEKLAKDEQDSVRILAINNCVALGKLKNSVEWQTQILAVVKACAEDKSWRVRYMIADNVKQLCEIFPAMASAQVVPLYLRLLSDSEVEVRTIAAARIAAVATVSPTKEFLETLMPTMEKLTYPRETSQHVRASLAGSVLSLTPIFGPKLTADYLINMVMFLIRDESPEVRLKLISTLGELTSVMSLDVLSQSLLPSIKELGKDRQWRVRLAVIDCMPSLAKYMGEVQFTQELNSLLMVWLVDQVFSVRAAAASAFRRLSEVLGIPWCETNVVPQLQALLTHKNYLYRISAMLCAGTLAELGGGPLVDKHLVPMVVNMSSDPVPNVRFNAAKTIQAMHGTCKTVSRVSIQEDLLPCLKRLLEDEDPDVKFFAKKAWSEIGDLA
jgi:serine/threonine-protein phosphatase 2A regulatory subunit A